MKLDVTVAKINKEYGENTIGFASELKFTKVERLSSGSLFLDWALGQNEEDKTAGWPVGRIVELFGPESAGKSLIASKTIAEAQKLGYDCLYIDCENSYDKDFAKTLGVDNTKLLLSRESRGEKVLEIICNAMASPKLRVVVLDSLASMIPKPEMEKSLDDTQPMAAMARLMSIGLRKLTVFNKHGTLIIIINQLRVNPGARFGNPEYTPGGRALKFYASIRVDVRKGDWIFDTNDKKKRVGHIVKFNVIKNKTDIPQKNGYFKFLYTGEIDQVDQLISLGLLNKTIIRKGAYYYVGEERFLGRDGLEVSLKKDEKLFIEAKKIVFGEEK